MRTPLLHILTLTLLALAGCATTVHEGYNSPLDMVLHSAFGVLGIQDIPAEKEKRLSPSASFASLQRAPANQGERQVPSVMNSQSVPVSPGQDVSSPAVLARAPLPAISVEAPPRNEIGFSISPRTQPQHNVAPQSEIVADIASMRPSQTPAAPNQSVSSSRMGITEHLERLLLLYRTFQYSQVLTEIEDLIKTPEITPQQKAVACLLAGASAHLIDDPLKTRYYLTIAIQTDPSAHPKPEYFPSAVCQLHAALQQAANP